MGIVPVLPPSFYHLRVLVQDPRIVPVRHHLVDLDDDARNGLALVLAPIMGGVGIVLVLPQSFCHLRVRIHHHTVPTSHLLLFFQHMESDIVEAEAGLLSGLLDPHLMTLVLVLL
jgi:hypothetical protein